MTTPSIAPSRRADVQYLLRLGDTCLILAQRLGEWCGHAPILEEDIALTNMSLDLVGQARAVLTRAGQLNAEDTGTAFDEDQLAFLREERDYRNPTLVELPRGDFAFTVLRNAMVGTLLKLLWQRLQSSSDAELAAIAGKAVKEARYHQSHAGDWVVRLGDGTDESARRMRDAVAVLWPYAAELFEDDEVDGAAAQAGLGPRSSDLREAWEAEMGSMLTQAGLQVPAPRAFRSAGKQGVHSEHMGFLLAEMQYLQRAYPGGAW
ncbi:1,2-phenylacetyl-CoA epoxidase subunit PaaC [Hydrogenophaga sp. 5NK40-0174]|uniref:1,2-phenylacetyl-CoA epoxidase subunit PaaC n=1 Tax=Hydrogenophaga sp. 5NK40-0174 TaxID=3127649 RepID=UPI00310A74E1